MDYVELPPLVWQAKPASEWPDFRATSAFIGVDTETHDPELKKRGPGFRRGEAHVCGVSLANEYGQKIYLPVAHVEGNVDPDQVRRYLQYQLGGQQDKCGANLMYDLQALRHFGVELEGDLCDIQVAEPLLDEERVRGYALDTLAEDYLGQHKDETVLEVAAKALGVDKKGGMSVLPAGYVGQYAEADALLPVQIYRLQRRVLETQGLEELFELEQRLQRVLFEMHWRGVRLDADKVEQLAERGRAREAVLEERLFRAFGKEINFNSGPQVGTALEQQGFQVPRTLKGNYSVQSEWLERQNHPVLTDLRDLRKLRKMRSDFLEGSLLGSLTGEGRIHAQWVQVRGGAAGHAEGTRSGRIASKRPNLTQIPARDPYWGPAIRECFLPDEGCSWYKFDYSQQEPRIALHYAVELDLPGSRAALRRYQEDPNTDYHQMVADLIRETTGRDIGRGPAKTINLGLSYGMGLDKLLASLGVGEKEGRELLKAYHAGVPYVKELERICSDRAQETGVIKTILGRCRRFDMWEPKTRRRQNFTPVRGRKAAEAKWPMFTLQRAYTYKAFNSLAQGGAADQMKKALVTMYDEGLMPQIQVYDEVDGSYNPEVVDRVSEIMREVVPMRVPFAVDMKSGRNWAVGKTPEEITHAAA